MDPQENFADLTSLSSPSARPAASERKGGRGPVIALIFLVPYAITITVILVLLLIRDRPLDPMERLPDPSKKGKGQPRLVEQHASLPAHLITQLNQPITIGMSEATPQKIEKAPAGDLILSLRVKNLSNNLALVPITDDFLRFAPDNDEMPLPFNFISRANLSADQDGARLYGGYLDWLHGPPQHETPFDGEIGPGDEELIRITTLERYRQDLAQLLDEQVPLLWRLRIRRGFLTPGTMSATAVIGVRFTRADVMPP